MSQDSTRGGFLLRDGTSQVARRPSALDPDYAVVDERNHADLLAFARRYGEELVYTDVDGEARGDWSGFLDPSLDLTDLAADLDGSQSFAAKPHLALFLSFLKLLGHARDRLNGLSRRHLDFYFRQVLRLRPRAAQPDQVRVIFELAPRSAEVLVPAGTRLAAGEDARGQARVYATDRDLVVSHAQIASLPSLYVARRSIGLGDALRAHRGDGPAACLAMLEIALADPLPPYHLLPDAGQPVFSSVSFADLEILAGMVRFTDENLFLSSAELDYLMKLVNEPFPGQPGDPDEESWQTNRWDEIYRVLDLAGRRRTGDPDYTVPPSVPPRDFPAALEAAVQPEFDRLPEPVRDALPDVGRYYQALGQLERYFQMPALTFEWLVKTAALGTADTAAWKEIEALLERAHRETVYARRRAELLGIRDRFDRASVRGRTQGFDALLLFAAGEDSSEVPDAFAIERLRPFLAQSTDFALLTGARSKIVADRPLSDLDWHDVAIVAEVAWRNRQALPEPRARRQEWLNLYPAADATRVGVERGVADGLPHWRTFGMAPPKPRAGAKPPPVLGWALSSPLLALAEGERTVTLTLGLSSASEPVDHQLIQQALGVEVSTREGWIQPDRLSVESFAAGELPDASLPGNPAALRFTLEFEDQTAALAAAKKGGLKDPTLRLMLLQKWDPELEQLTTSYPQLRRLKLTGVHLEVRTAGLQSLRLQHEDTALDPRKPFEPFGGAPSQGSRFLFGHPEMASKKLDQLSAEIVWMDVPKEGLTEYYKNYGLTGQNPFSATLRWMERHQRLEPALTSPLLPNAPQVIGLGPEQRVLFHQEIAIPPPQETESEARQGGASGEPDEDLQSWSRYLCWELNAPDFQHRVYPALAAKRALEIARDPDPADGHAINPPYTPRIQNLTISYTASLTLDLTASGRHQVFHLHPFGHSAVEPGPAGTSLLPAYDHQGELLLGLRDVRAPQNVSLWFEMAEGSADPDLEPVPVRWSYLDGDHWQSLEAGRLVLDTTLGLRRSGIVELALEPAASGQLLPADLYWLRAAVSHAAASVCDTIAIHTQGMSATFVEPEDTSSAASVADETATRSPLAPGSIRRLMPPTSGIAGVRQPYSSYGGSPSESDLGFDTRVSERLRHKQRALCLWDYERLTLEQFPKIYKAKCLPRGLFGRPTLSGFGSEDQEIDPLGKVEVIVIPDVRHQLPFDPFEPKASSDVLTEVEIYLRSKAPANAAISVRNARFVAVQVRCGVRFNDPGNEGYYRSELQDELNRFLSPWAYDEGADIVIGGSLYANSIVDFLDRRSYVDHVTHLRLFKSDDSGRFVEVPTPPASSSEGYRVSAERPDEVLVAARQHIFDDVTDLEHGEDLETGINFMQVEFDFIVGGERR